ncbi:MAG: hypothetical protein JXA49_02060 [Actinobacteria bacterium]|nr:hypothetical protein [Actinomycetota bacterium]
MDGKKPLMYCPLAKENCKDTCVFFNREGGDFDPELSIVEWNPENCGVARALKKFSKDEG